MTKPGANAFAPIRGIYTDHMSHLLPDDYPGLLQEIKGRIRAAQYEALKAVNKELIALYWDIGRMIAERQKEASWGKAVVEQSGSFSARPRTGPLSNMRCGNRTTHRCSAIPHRLKPPCRF